MPVSSNASSSDFSEISKMFENYLKGMVKSAVDQAVSSSSGSDAEGLQDSNNAVLKASETLNAALSQGESATEGSNESATADANDNSGSDDAPIISSEDKGVDAGVEPVEDAREDTREDAREDTGVGNNNGANSGEIEEISEIPAAVASSEDEGTENEGTEDAGVENNDGVNLEEANNNNPSKKEDELVEGDLGELGKQPIATA
jgi:hypothetical protein